jgi:uncharacterized protein YbaR (Trm112 family)
MVGRWVGGKLRYQIWHGIWYLLICRCIWTILPLTFSTQVGEIARHTVTNDVPRKVNLDKDLLAILCCPETKQAVVLADEALIQKVNGAIDRGTLKNKAEKSVTEKLDGGLIRSDNQILYPVREDIPVMLIDEGIPLAQVS